jgi:signal transduction histidine kinase
MASTGERIGRRDIAIATVLSALGLLLMYDNVHGDIAAERADPNSDAHSAIHVGALLPLDFALPLFLLVTVPLLWRRAAPIPSVAASFAGLLVNIALLGTEFLRCGVVLPTAFLFAFATGARLDRPAALVGLGLSSGLVFVDVLVEFGPATTAVMLAVNVASWSTGRLVRSRGRMVDELRAQNVELREARDERARLEVATDRARLSRELDELLQRRLGELARMADEGDGAETTARFAAIEQESRRTLEEMRAAVRVLRDDAAVAPTSPQPTLTQLEALLLRAKGGEAQLTVEGGPRVLPPAVELSAYRIVEQLLEALEDAPDVEVRVRFADDALELAVSGPARRSAKAAIERARERARLENGSVEATVRRGRAEAVASLPVLVTA